MRSKLAVPALLCAAALVVGCTTLPRQGDAYYGDRYYDDHYYGDYGRIYSVPPPRVEYRGYAPYPDYIWLDGYWNRIGSRHYWVPGYWAPPGTRYHERRLRDARERELALKRDRERERKEARERERADARERERRREDERQRERWRDDVRKRRLDERPSFSSDPEERRRPALGKPGRDDFERRNEWRERSLQPGTPGGDASVPNFATPVAPPPRATDSAPPRRAVPVAPRVPEAGGSRDRGSRSGFRGDARPTFGGGDFGGGDRGGGRGGGGATFGGGGNN